MTFFSLDRLVMVIIMMFWLIHWFL